MINYYFKFIFIKFYSNILDRWKHWHHGSTVYSYDLFIKTDDDVNIINWRPLLKVLDTFPSHIKQVTGRIIWYSWNNIMFSQCVFEWGIKTSTQSKLSCEKIGLFPLISGFLMVFSHQTVLCYNNYMFKDIYIIEKYPIIKNVMHWKMYG